MSNPTTPTTFRIAMSLLMGAMATIAALDAVARDVAGEPSWTPVANDVPRWKAGDFPAGKVARMEYVELSPARILQLEKRNAAQQFKATQIGIARNARLESRTSALPTLAWKTTRDGGSVARIEVKSPIALGLRVGLRLDSVHPRAELRFAGSDQPAHIVATMNGRQVGSLANADKVFWTPATDGETQFIEVYLPAGVATTSVRLQAPQLSHLLANSRNDFIMAKNVGASGVCNVDTSCRVAELGSAFVNAKNAVARMVFVESGSAFTCTGTLLADTVATTQIPYFYSANHCISDQTVASTLNTFWGFEATSCGSNVAAANLSLAGGADYLYSDAATDALLLRLRDAAPNGSQFSGWSANTLPASTAVIGIHHPAGDLKKVSSGQQLSADANHIEVGWLSGTTEGGSSGSGIFSIEANGYRLRGGLYGGFASCANTGSLANTSNRDYYSRLDVVYPSISQYLAPAPAAPQRVNGSQPLIPPRPAATTQAAAPPTPRKVNERRVRLGPVEP